METHKLLKADISRHEMIKHLTKVICLLKRVLLSIY